MMRKSIGLFLFILLLALVACGPVPEQLVQAAAVDAVEPAATVCTSFVHQGEEFALCSVVTGTDTPPASTPAPTSTPEPTATSTAVPPTATAVAGPVAPYPDAPLCPSHDDRAYHGLWDAERGCHYDHEHGAGYPHWAHELWGDYTQYTGGEISYAWQTGTPPDALENQLKHNGYKADAKDLRPYGCVPQFARDNCVIAFYAQTHNLAVPHEYLGREHSFFTIVEICNAAGACGTLVTGGRQDYGQFVSGYQGLVVPLPGSPDPAYDSPVPPYRTAACIGSDRGTNCRTLGRGVLFDTTWDGEIRSNQDSLGAAGNQLLTLAFRQRDIYFYLEQDQRTSPDPVFTLVCADKEGNYQAAGCEANGTTYGVYKFRVLIPSEWDGLSGFDEDGAANGVITHHGWSTRWGVPAPECAEASQDCAPLILEGVPVGKVSLNLARVSEEDFLPAFAPHVLPERDIYFCGDPDVAVVCAEDDNGAWPSGWVGEHN